ncbi:hypothetical protein WPS_24860 [Vulcanimicrobium alpinum]|uniref:Peptidase M56 domain-containing protein n=1 Tax=Vulcanimicrobium alpinum TaxID=3016050 RepID=A0AAN1XYE1_UNVUL|nr:hypothetical protein [Vulcanimicrobium alpinum]BDE07210.1 hypothetical protein WPS_24860 [Vulcanimicrobium alpinum]
MRFIRALWPVVFLVPLSWWADRGCGLAGVDPLYHATVWVHERLGWFIGALAATSAGVVVAKIVVARMRFARLGHVAEPLPGRVRAAFERASVALGVAVPTVLYVDLAAPIATTVFGRTIVLSRGFVEPLEDADVELVARHELVHVRHADATAGVLWHLLFAALLIPGFEPLERRLHAGRERSANVIAAAGGEERYVALLVRLAHGTNLCVEARLGLEAAARRPEDRWLVWAAPLAVTSLAVALPISHAAFRHDLPYLLAHHC